MQYHLENDKRSPEYTLGTLEAAKKLIRLPQLGDVVGFSPAYLELPQVLMIHFCMDFYIKQRNIKNCIGSTNAYKCYMFSVLAFWFRHQKMMILCHWLIALLACGFVCQNKICLAIPLTCY